VTTLGERRRRGSGDSRRAAHIAAAEDPVNKVEDVLREGQDVDVWIRRVRKDRIE